MSTLIYKNIQGSTEFDQDSDIFFGKLIGINGVVMYEGKNAEEFKKNFMSAVDEYIEICEKNEIPVKKEFKGVFNVRTTPEIHEELNAISVRKGIKMNAIVNEALTIYLHQENTIPFGRLARRKEHLLNKHVGAGNFGTVGKLLNTEKYYWNFSCDENLLDKINIKDITNPKDFVK